MSDIPLRSGLGVTFKRPITRFTIPTPLGPDEPGIILDQTVPAELITAYSPTTLVGCILFQNDSNDYAYFALGIGASGMNVFYGHVNGGVVYGLYDTRWASGLVTSLLQIQKDPLGTKSPGVTYDNIDNQIQISRGSLTLADSNANSAAIGAETVVLTGFAITILAQTFYRVKVQGNLIHSAAQIATVRIRKTNATGQLLGEYSVQVAGAEDTYHDFEFIFRRELDINLSSVVLVATLEASAGTVTHKGSVAGRRRMTLEALSTGGFTGPIIT